MFDQMYDCVKLHNTSCMMACRPVVIHAVLMSIIFEHYKQLTKLTERQEDTKTTINIQYARFVGVCEDMTISEV